MNKLVHYAKKDGIAHIHMDDGKANAMKEEFVDQLLENAERAKADDVKAVVISGRKNFFSGGADLKSVPLLAPEDFSRVLEKTEQMFREVYLFTKPVVAASLGHAIAGGMVLFCAADYRVALREASHRYGMNEGKTGIPLIGPSLAVPRSIIPSAYHVQMLLHGETVTAEVAHQRGIINELLESPEAVLTHAMGKAAELGKCNPPAYRATKRAIRKPILDAALDFVKAEADAGELPQGNLVAFGLNR